MQVKLNVNPHHLRTMIFAYGRMSSAYTELTQEWIYGCAKDFRMTLIRNILWEKYRNLYPDLSPVYEKWKKKNSSTQGFWKLWGSLANAISIRETPKGYSVGIEKDVMPIRTSSMGKQKKLTPVWMYAWYGEYSHWQRGIFRGIQPSRPVFRPTQYEYRLMFFKKRDDLRKKMKKVK